MNRFILQQLTVYRLLNKANAFYHKRQALFPILSQVNPMYNPPYDFYKINCNIINPFTPTSSD